MAPGFTRNYDAGMKSPQPPLDDEPQSSVDEDLLAAVRGLPPAPLVSPELRALIERIHELPTKAGQTDADPDRPPTAAPNIPGYELLEELGRGGMGVVYKARQLRLNRLVALKVLAAEHLASSERRARFQTEAQAIACLQHPHIVQVYEVGEHEGQPYLSLEYLAGGNLAQRLHGDPLPSRKATLLVEMLARAVSAAHQQGVVHRDLKPANVLLSESREPASDDETLVNISLPGGLSTPKIADFGLARHFGDSALGLNDGLTRTGMILGTPSYMAPEQASGKPESIGPPADIYALGTILYELITGRPPFKAASVLETLEQVRRDDPVPPLRLQPKLPRDLQTVCLKCLEKQPARRYASARELAEDLERFRRGEPIHAHPSGALQRSIKWARRRPALASLIGVCLVAALGAVIGVVVHNQQLAQQVQRAEQGEAKALAQKQRADAGYQRAKQTLDRMLTRLDSPRLTDVPQVLELKETLRRDVVNFYEDAYAKLHFPDPEVRFDTAQALKTVSTIELALGQSSDAEKNLNRALGLLRDLSRQDEQRIEYRQVESACLNELGAMFMGNDNDRAVDYHRQALKIRQLLCDKNPSSELRDALAQSHNNLASTFVFQHRPEAEEHFQKAIDIRERLAKEHPENPYYPARIAEAYINLGLIYGGTDRWEKGEAAYTQAEELLSPIVQAHPEFLDDVVSLGAAFSNWGLMRKDHGRAEESLPIFARAISLLTPLVKKEPRFMRARSTLHNAHGARAQALEMLGRYQEAAADWGSIADLAIDERPRRLGQLGQILALVHAGDYADAVAHSKSLEEQAEQDSEFAYNLACLYSLSTAAAESDTTIEEGERDDLAKEYAAHAVALLRRAQASGMFKEPAMIEQLTQDPDLAALRGREEFESFLRELKP
jgi:serine/threonine protein kinase/tetratricopeptide (TPR) repeat protein